MVKFLKKIVFLQFFLGGTVPPIPPGILGPGRVGDCVQGANRPKLNKYLIHHLNISQKMCMNRIVKVVINLDKSALHVMGNIAK